MAYQLPSTPEVTPDEWEARKAFVGFSAGDAQLLVQLRLRAEACVDAVVEELYRHILAEEEMRAFFPDAETLQRVKGLQKRYFLGLTAGDYGPEYLADRLRIGRVHQRTGIPPSWYMGTYSLYMQFMFHELLSSEPDYEQRMQLFVALLKIISLDQELALTTYIAADQAALQRVNEALEARVLERTRELEAFSYSVSHDLRAPLRAMEGFSRILQEEHAGQLVPEAQRYLGLVRSNARQMGLLVDDLLTFSQLGRQPLQKRLLDPASLVRQVLEELGHAMRGRQVDVRLLPMPPYLADSSLLKQVWLNLLENAVKYSRKQEQARIEVGWRPELEAYYVQDNGVGFDMRYAGKLFEVFQRLHSAEEYEGTGVGLAIVQRIVHRHGGRVWAEGEVGRGATFYFSLPKGETL